MALPEDIKHDKNAKIYRVLPIGCVDKRHVLEQHERVGDTNKWVDVTKRKKLEWDVIQAESTLKKLRNTYKP